jgi:hypothetical protein
MNRDAPQLLSPSLRADPPADDTVTRMLAGADGPTEIAARIAAVNRELARWQTNGGLASWQAGPDLDPRAAAALKDYLAAYLHLPEWADAATIARAEALFMDMSMLSCTLLFCASLPECYVLPDLSAVLHAAGQLEAHTDYRVRSTAAMIFPVMLAGGLSTPEGGGVAQALKVRLIHATIRHLVLRGPPAQAPGAPALPPLAPAGGGLHHTLYAHGWDTATNGLPCNQEELAYTLLTFSYVFVRGLRTLRLALDPVEEEAYLHTWNVLGHMLGIDRALMASTMAQAELDFIAMQARGRALVRTPDPRPLLAADLMKAMENEIPIRLLKPLPTLLTRLLCKGDVTKDLGLNTRVSLFARALFAVGLALVQGIDAVARRLTPGFSISRMLTRALGQRLVTRFLLDQTRPLRLPEALLNAVGDATDTWRTDPKAPRWLNRFEAKLSGQGLPPHAATGAGTPAA